MSEHLGLASKLVADHRSAAVWVRGTDDGHCVMRAIKPIERLVPVSSTRHVVARLHTRPINVVVYHGSRWRPGFEVGFPLRCFQRLSRPHIATLHCGWRHNSSTRGASIPVLSY